MNEEYLTAKELAEQTGVGHSRIRQLAESVPGGRLTETGWRFPVSAFDYVAGLPGRGRPPSKKAVQAATGKRVVVA